MFFLIEQEDLLKTGPCESWVAMKALGAFVLYFFVDGSDFMGVEGTIGFM